MAAIIFAVAERLETELLQYFLKHRLVVNGDTWEYWKGPREIAMLRCKVGIEVMDFHGELLGSVLKLYVEVQIPAKMGRGGRVLDSNEIGQLASRMHLVLLSMKQRNAVLWNAPPRVFSVVDRERILSEFKEWMERRQWSVQINRPEERLLMRRKGFQLFRKKSDESELLEQGAWVARAFHALLDMDIDRTYLFIGQGAQPTTPWRAAVDW